MSTTPPHDEPVVGWNGLEVDNYDGKRMVAFLKSNVFMAVNGKRGCETREYITQRAAPN